MKLPNSAKQKEKTVLLRLGVNFVINVQRGGVAGDQPTPDH
jgi:hypothetical protein